MVSVDVAPSGFTVVIGPMTLAFDDLRGHFCGYSPLLWVHFLSDQYSCLICGYSPLLLVHFFI